MKVKDQSIRQTYKDTKMIVEDGRDKDKNDNDDNFDFDKGKYKLRLIPPNCHQEQMVLEIVSALDHLDAITNEIFSKTESRLSSARERMATLMSRVNNASTKINQLKESKAGIRPISASKFPEITANGNGGMLQGIPILKLKSLPSQHQIVANNYEIIAKIKSLRKFYEPPVKNIEELLQFYQVRDKNDTLINEMCLDGNAKTIGLAKPPAMLNNIDSFFVFNSFENA